MIIMMKPEATEQQVQAVISAIKALGHNHHPSRLKTSVAISVDNKRDALDPESFKGLEGVMKVFPIEVTLPTS